MLVQFCRAAVVVRLSAILSGDIDGYCCLLDQLLGACSTELITIV